MTTIQAPQSVLPPPPSDATGDVIHTVCCDPNLALCGVELAGGATTYVDQPTTCQPCGLVDALEVPCGQPGCDIGDAEVGGLLDRLAAAPAVLHRCGDPLCLSNVDVVPDPAQPGGLCSDCEAAAFDTASHGT